jgi:integrase
MGRRRKLNRHMPENMRLSHGGYFYTLYRDGHQQWIPLGRDYGAALLKYRDVFGYTAPVGRTVQDLVNRFREDELPRVKASTRRNYSAWMPAIEKTWGAMSVKDLRQPHAAVFLDQYPKKVTANRIVTLLTTMLKRAKRWGWIDTNFLEGLEKNAEKRRMRIISQEEWTALLSSAGRQYGPLLRLARFTALRRGDICALKWSNVRGDRLVVETSKTSAAISIAIAGDLAAVLEELRRGITPFPTRPLFAVAGGRALSSKMLGHHFDRIREAAQVEGVNFHDIRRTRITEITERYGLEFAQRLAAHRDPQTTERYNVPEATRIDWPDDEIRGTPKIRGTGKDLTP